MLKKTVFCSMKKIAKDKKHGLKWLVMQRLSLGQI
jgi:hypothetical protein